MLTFGLIITTAGTLKVLLKLLDLSISSHLFKDGEIKSSICPLHINYFAVIAAADDIDGRTKRLKMEKKFTLPRLHRQRCQCFHRQLRAPQWQLRQFPPRLTSL